MSKSYLVAKNNVIEEIVVNRSRFICYLTPCSSIDTVKTFLKEIQQQHPQASHHCYAYLSERADSSQHYGFSDDGEPSGTAGRPMLSTLQGHGVGEICAVVVRYFGGTKLGTGGLQRAYGASVRQALTLLMSKTKIPMVSRTLACQYTQINDVLHVIEKSEGIVVEQKFSDSIELKVKLPEDNLEITEQKIQIISSGSITLGKIDTLPDDK
ncbi:YigZ family protein [Colwellia sp. UCD-KL20]|uniref:YigZ family protein n=1 Tax=Colwellia sp. UCD-KL20 TaxID=1917165 RepID=UPI0009703C4E|nr:YigZ family protein [Colwellia sp. UCD-KL20]